MKIKALIISLFNAPNDFVSSLMCGFRYAKGKSVMLMTGRKTHSDLPVICNDDALCVIARIPPRAPGASLVVYENGVWNVLVNAAMLTQPEWIIEAVLAHEDAHYQLHGEYLKSLVAQTPNKTILLRSQVIEYEADAHAAKQGVDIFNALKTMESFGYDMSDRLNHLKNN